MPYLHITSNADVAHEEKQLCLAACSKVLAETLGKSTQYLMTAWADAAMDLGESAAPTAFVEIRGLRLRDDACEQLSPKLCEAIQSTVEIHPERIFINVQDIAPKDWGWNGKTFG